MGATDDASVLLRQVAIYVGHTVLRLRRRDCADALQLSRWAATRAFQTVEKRRASDRSFNNQIERLEDAIASRLAATRIGLVPPTQGLMKAPVAAFAAPAPEGA